MCIFALSKENEYAKTEYIHAVSNIIKIGSMENGTVHEAKMLATIKNRLYLCNAFETKVQFIEY